MSKNYQNDLQDEINRKADEIIMQLPPFSAAFFDHMKTIDRSARTRLQYAYDLKRFFDHLQSQSGFRDIDVSKCYKASEIVDILSYSDIQEYLNTLNSSEYTDKLGKKHSKRNSSSYKARNISSLRSLFKYYYKLGDTEKDFSTLLELPKIKNNEKFPLDSSQILRMLDVINNDDDATEFQKTRDTAILTMLFGTGMRVSELVGIDLSDIDLKKKSIVITRKGGDQDVVLYGDEVAEALSAYLQERDEFIQIQPETALLLSNRKKRISVRTIQDMVSKTAHKAGLSNINVTPHSARHTYGSSLYKNTGDIYLVADSLHHSSIQTTRRYAKMSDEYRKKAQEHSSDVFKAD